MKITRFKLTACAAVLGLTMTLVPAASWAETVRILAFGDSLTAGFGLPPDRGYVAQLQTWLRARGHDVVVLNGGLSGDTAPGGRMRIGYSLARHQPDAVIIELGANDMLIGLAPRLTQSALDAIVQQAGANDRPVLLVGIALPSRSNAQEWAEIWPRLAKRHDILLLENLVAPLLAMPPDQQSQMLQRDGLHPSAEGIAQLIEHLGPQVEALIAQVIAERSNDNSGSE